jgi:MbtH protein
MWQNKATVNQIGAPMDKNGTEYSTIYRVVVNHEEQYSIWPSKRENPAGWQDVGKTGPQDKCLALIKALWSDMRPLTLKKNLEGEI